jgi:hypothetical protein
MKVFNHAKPGTVVKANAAQLALFILLLENKQLVDPERASRLAGAAVFSAFDNFATDHIKEAIDEATKTGEAEVTLEGFKETKEEHEATLAASLEAQAAFRAKAEAEKPVEPVTVPPSNPPPPPGVTLVDPSAQPVEPEPAKPDEPN